MRRTPLDRRSFLRGAALGGAAVAIPLPRLAGMLDGNGTAYANGASLPLFFGSWFYGNGVLLPNWVPSATGTDFPLSQELAPLAKVKSALTVVSGMDIKFKNSNHTTAPPAILTGASSGFLPFPKDRPPSQKQTIDQTVAQKLGSATQYRSLHVGVCQVGDSSGDVISFSGPGAPNPNEYSPQVLFQRLFGGGQRMPATGGMPEGIPSTLGPKKLAARRSVLDAVIKDAMELKTGLGTEDVRRIDQHLEGIRDLERQVDRLAQSVPAATGGCGAPSTGDRYPRKHDNKREASREVNAAMAELITHALACDLTRVFTFMFTSPAAHVYYKELGIPTTVDYHDDLTHMEPLPQPTVNRAVTYNMECFATLLEKMQSTPYGAGTVLDRAIVLATTCCTEGRTHDIRDFPLLVGGRAGGQLKGNVHYRSMRENTSKVPFTLLNLMGLGLAEWGVAEGRVTDGVGAILA